MECNKDEAIRAKSIAESKLELKDYLGAKKFASKAQTLYPGLDGISQMLMTLDVYVSAEKKINGEVDWYGVLGVGPSADDETIKKQYRKLALMLHPDKNNSAGANGAFKLISEASGLLSDKTRRSAYNQITGHKGFQQKVPTHTGGSSAVHANGPSSSTYTGGPRAHGGGGSSAYAGPSAHSGGPWAHTGGASPHTSGGPPGPSMESPFSKFAKRKPPTPKSQKKKSAKATGPSKPSPAPSNQGIESFWTVCDHCGIQYEYHKIYRNNTLLCPNCKKAFMALEIPRPVTKPRLHKPNPCPPTQQPKPSNNNNLRAPPPANDRGKDVVSDAQKSGTGQANPNIFTHATYQRAPPSMTANMANFEDKLKRGACADSKNVSVGMDDFLKKRKLDDGHKSYNKMPERNFNFGTAGTTLDGDRELTPLVMRKLLSENGRKEILKKLNEYVSEGPPVKQEINEKTGRERNNSSNGKNCRNNENGDSSADNARKQKEETKENERKNDNGQKWRKNTNSDSSADKDADEPYSGTVMNVPDPDFYDFDQDRTENSFSDNDVWAAYDNDDGMPRFYVLIHKVISKKPFKLKISWLNSKTTTEFGPLDWVGSGFYKTCGEFWVGKHEICKFVNAFSQRVKWSKGPRGSVVILPMKGDVWALYRNWSSSWNTSTPDDVIHKYDMVMVLNDYNEEKGVSVARLAKVVGYRTVFCPNMEMEGIMKIPKEEMFRFSHLVPHHELACREAPNAPEGCVELDPAATPLELLQMATDGIMNGADGKKVETGVVESVAVTSFKEIGSGGVNKICRGIHRLGD